MGKAAKSLVPQLAEFSKALLTEFHSANIRTKLQALYYGYAQKRSELGADFIRQKAVYWQRLSTLEDNVTEQSAITTAISLLLPE